MHKCRVSFRREPSGGRDEYHFRRTKSSWKQRPGGLDHSRHGNCNWIGGVDHHGNRSLTRKTFALIVLGLFVLLVVVLVSAGVITFFNTEGETGITIDKQKLEETAEEAVQETRQAADALIEKTSEGFEEAGEELRELNQDDASDSAESDVESGEAETTGATPAPQ